MYGEADFTVIERRIRRNWIVWVSVVALCLVLFVLGLARRVPGLTYLSAVAAAVAGCFGFLYCQLPCLRYRGFLRDLRDGLSREMAGEIVSIADTLEPQDGAMVLQVHLRLDDGECIVYLNAAKRDLFPPVGSRVQLKLCGRHVLEAHRI